MTSQTSVTITCGIQPNSVATMAMKVLCITCNICIHDLPDMNALIPQACTCSLGLQANMSGKFPMPMLQPLNNIPK